MLSSAGVSCLVVACAQFCVCFVSQTLLTFDGDGLWRIIKQLDPALLILVDGLWRIIKQLDPALLTFDGDGLWRIIKQLDPALLILVECGWTMEDN